MWGERADKSLVRGDWGGGAGVCTEGRPRSCARVHGAAGCEPGVQLAVAWWARLAAGRVHYGRAAGGCPMGQAGSWEGALWACSWRLPDGPGWQLGVHNGRAAGGCPMGQAGSWGCTMGVQLAVARWARLAAGGVLWAYSWRLPDGPGWHLGVYYGRTAGGCPMGQAGSWGCTMGMPWLSRLAAEDAGHKCLICRRDLFLISNLW